MLAIEVRETGGPNVLVAAERDAPAPGPGEILLRQTAIGINYIDVSHRKGAYKLKLPFTPGLEGAGRVEAVGPGVTGLEPGDRVAYASAPPPGGYVEARLLPAERAVKLPDDLSDEDAAAFLFKGLTVQMLVKGAYRVGPGDVVVVHAAAGGVGVMLASWAKHLGASMVIGAVSTKEKAEIARRHGCDHVLVYGADELPARVAALTDGRKANVVYDSVGKDTFLASLDCLRPRGTLAWFGQASGNVQSFDPSLLGAKGSLFLTRPGVFTYTADPAEYRERAADTLAALRDGILPRHIGGRYKLADAAKAHADLEGRRTTGSLLLIP